MNIFKQFMKSIYSPKDIALFRLQGIGKTIMYVFLLTLISIIPSIIYFSSAFTTGLEMTKTYMNKTPDFSISNGELTADTKVPVIIKENSLTFILDPTGAISDADIANEGDAIGLLKNEFVISAGGQTKTSSYSMMPGLELSKDEVNNLITNIISLKNIIIPLTGAIMYLMAIVSMFIEITIVALIGLALANILGRKLSYSHLWRMATYSETLPTLFFTIMAALKTTVPNGFIINWIVVLIVLLLAINEIPKQNQSN
ncbi:DUF1189 domain-containing protein [Neobacillus thermocopriae]|uniref:DUF1189 domain-containing protein n=1 Tax=Neobacillus thermocopriae TaxID=1215031 RepID=A0A6B3TTP6_9BACI|nr:DUF1189 domain-containing protein [Neobacillus thermocopriae]NEX79686.1 DUF1189 domain-containing protein [Neobacillus thermocopriae]